VQPTLVDESRHRGQDTRSNWFDPTARRSFGGTLGVCPSSALELGDRVRVLDGLYVALAEQRDCPLLTTDARLAAADPPCEVVLIPR
jgi:hypothetical protein